MDTHELPVSIDGDPDRESKKRLASPDSDVDSASQPVVLPVVFLAADSADKQPPEETPSESSQDGKPAFPSTNASDLATGASALQPVDLPESVEDTMPAAPTDGPQQIDSQGASAKLPSDPKTPGVEGQPQPIVDAPDSQTPGVEAIAQRIRLLKNPRMNSDSIAEPPTVSTPADDQPSRRELPRVPQLQVLVQLADARALFAKVMQDVAKDQAEALRKIAIYEIEQAFFKYRASQRAADKGLRGPMGY